MKNTHIHDIDLFHKVVVHFKKISILISERDIICILQ